MGPVFYTKKKKKKFWQSSNFGFLHGENAENCKICEEKSFTMSTLFIQNDP